MFSESPDQRSQSNNNFPRSLGSVSRAEFFEGEGSDGHPLELQFTNDSGALPPDLTGYVFIIGPVGSVDSKLINTDNTENKLQKLVSPAADGWTSLLNGDGMIYRLDFNSEVSGARLNSRIVKAPCYYFDVLTNDATRNDLEKLDAEKYAFTSYGVTRISSKLGIRNQLNTAFLPLLSNKPDQPDRLLVTWDAGRPYEIDTKTLEVVTPVGRLIDWKLVNPLFQFDGLPFSQIQSSAHPCFDCEKQQFITVNICKSLFSFLPPLEYLQGLWNKKSYFRKKYDRFINRRGSQKFWDTVRNFIGKLFSRSPAFLSEGAIRYPVPFLCSLFQWSSLHLVLWEPTKDDGRNFKTYEVRLDDGSHVNGNSIPIKQTVHQMGITKDYILLMETAFKLNLEEMVGSSKENLIKKILTRLTLGKKQEDKEPLKEDYYKEVEGLARALLDHPQNPDSNLYIIKRSDLEKSDLKKQNFVFAKKVVLTGEIAHFLVDYANPNDQISLHIAFSCAWDVAEWVRGNADQLDGKPLENPFSGILCGPLDISRLGRVVLDGKTAKVLSEPLLKDLPEAWGPALYAYRDYPTPEKSNPEEQLQHLYWVCAGCYEELITDHLLHLYEQYRNRTMPLKEVLEITKKGHSGSLLRLDITLPTPNDSNHCGLVIGDSYELKEGGSLLSPQFVPKLGGTGESTDGYIVCTYHYGTGNETDNGNQIWIFDAANLKQGPICKLWHPQLKLGFTVHTTWLPEVSKRQASYCIDMYQDYGPIVKEQPKEVKQLFKKLFPKYNWE